MRRFETIDISGDAGVKAFGRDVRELFVNAALGMFSLVTDLDSVRESRELKVSAEGSAREGLLVAWLNELIFFFDTTGFIGKRIVFEELDETHLRAALRGEDFDPLRHASGLLIKAATYHRLRVEPVEGGWEAEVIFDI